MFKLDDVNSPTTWIATSSPGFAKYMYDDTLNYAMAIDVNGDNTILKFDGTSTFNMMTNSPTTLSQIEEFVVVNGVVIVLSKSGTAGTDLMGLGHVLLDESGSLT